VNTAAKEETTSGLLAVLLETRVRGSAPKNATGISPSTCISSTTRWACGYFYDQPAVGRLVGLDYFGARYFSAAQGRFTSPDPLNWLKWQTRDRPAIVVNEASRLEQEKSGDLGDKKAFRERLENPQYLNAYTYVRNNPLRYTDPLGLWDSEGHNDLTWAAADGQFSSGDKFLIAAANLAVDDFSNQGNNAAHYMPGTGGDAEKLISTAIDRASSLEVAGKHGEAMKALGAGMHTVQDRTAHDVQKAGWGKHGVALLPFTSSPDKRKDHPKEYKQAMEDSKKYIERYKKAVEEKRRHQGGQ
jgi:hypothetical protein